MKNYLKSILLTVTVALFSTSIEAQGNKYKDKQDYKHDYKNNEKKWNGNTVGRWQKIGSKTVDKITEKDDFRPSSRNYFSEVKVIIRKNPVTINKMTIYFDNGQSQRVLLSRSYNDGEETRIIKLVGGKRVINRITFEYRSKNLLHSRAVVEVWAKRV